MAAARTFKPVGGTNSTDGKKLRFIRPSELAEAGSTGLLLEGIYVGTVPNNLDDTKSDFKFETEAEIVVINSTGSLAYKMGKIDPGSLVQVIYNGKQKIAKGKMAGRDAHSFDVLVAVEE